MLRAIDRLGPAAAFAVAGLALVAAVLVPLGAWHPAVAWPAAIVLALLAWRLTGVLMPEPVALDRRAVILTAVITLWYVVLHSGHVIIRRDGGAYALYTQWIATRHGLPVDAGLSAFGGGQAFGVERFTLSSPAFYQVLDGPVGPDVQAEIVPQFLVGAPSVYSLGWWAGAPLGWNWGVMQSVPALLTGLALLSFAALLTRLIGPTWAILGVAGLGLVMPLVLVARTTYSEPGALLMLLAAAVLAVDAARTRRRELAVAAGVLIGLTGLFRADAIREVALVVLVCAVLAVRRSPVAIPLASAALLTETLALAIGWSMSRPYLSAIGPSLRPVLFATAAIAVLAIVLVPLLRRVLPGSRAGAQLGGEARSATADPVRSGSGPLWSSWSVWDVVAGGLVAALGLVLASRPLWLTVRQDPNDTGSKFVAILQRSQRLPEDGGRTYAEHSLDWVTWYLGWPAVIAAWSVLAVLAALALRWWRRGTPDAPEWLLPVLVGFLGTVLVLFRPGITPDHPWADRRLVPVVLPLMVGTAVAGIAWASRRWPDRRWRGRPWVAPVGVLLLMVPVVWASAPISFRRTEAGEIDAIAAVCAQLRPNDVVATLDATEDGIAERSGSEWVQVVRGVCGHPASALLTPRVRTPQAAAQLADLVAAQGNRLVLLTAQENEQNARKVMSYAGDRFESPQRAVRLETTEDRKWLTRRPTGVARLVIDVWLAPAR